MIKRYRGKTVFDVIEDEDGSFVLYSDLKEMLVGFVQTAVDSGADEQKMIDYAKSAFKPKH